MHMSGGHMIWSAHICHKPPQAVGVLHSHKELKKLVQPVLNIGSSGRPRKKPLAEESSRAKNFLEMIKEEGVVIASLLAATAGHPQLPKKHQQFYTPSQL